MPDAFPGRTTGEPVGIFPVDAERVVESFREEAEQRILAATDLMGVAVTEAARNRAVTPDMPFETGAMQDGFRWRRTGESRVQILNVARSLRGHPYPQRHAARALAAINAARDFVRQRWRTLLRSGSQSKRNRA